ncbi:hypothetical protein [Halohasta litorea]|uniref:Uncharacterized protein n=1 Tax=Halohasta litorea TaxID=869891 RepID=A0ABD6DCS1_9EURY|nr:hypothetical protein [Halohasta litorea]
MDSAVAIGARLRSRLLSLLFDDVIPEAIAWLFVVGGMPTVLWGLLRGTSLPAGGASQLVLVFFGSVLSVWGVSELLPRRYRRSIALLRIYAILGSGVAVFALLMLLVFWWGLQQPL